MIGMGPPASPGEEDIDLIDAGKNPVSLVVGGSYMSHADSFAIIRGRHLDACVLGAYEVAANGDLANWALPEGLPGVGGAMDLALGAKAVYVMCAHNSKHGRPKLVQRTELPLTAQSAVSRVYTELGIFVPTGEGYHAIAMARDLDPEQLARRTGAPVSLDDDCIDLPR
jgi:3-oxoadipate CoA-transferase beta subunit